MPKATEKNKGWNWKKVLFLGGRLLLGGVFVYASVDKIIHPAAFAEAIFNYQILPDELINLTSIILPWVELLLGAFLILGVWLPGCLFLANLLMMVFIGALLLNAIRGLDIHCGCFTSDPQDLLWWYMVWFLIRDGMILTLAAYLLFNVFQLKKDRSDNEPSQK